MGTETVLTNPLAFIESISPSAINREINKLEERMLEDQKKLTALRALLVFRSALPDESASSMSKEPAPPQAPLHPPTGRIALMIYECLKEHTEGLSLKEIANCTELTYQQVANCIHDYYNHFAKLERGVYALRRPETQA